MGRFCRHCGEPIDPQPGEILRLGPVTLDTETKEVRVWGERRRVQRGKETAILEAMMRAPGRIFTRDNLENIARTWDSSSNALNVHLHRIRRNVGDALELKEEREVGWTLTVGSGRAPRQIKRKAEANRPDVLPFRPSDPLLDALRAQYPAGTA